MIILFLWTLNSSIDITRPDNCNKLHYLCLLRHSFEKYLLSGKNVKGR